MMYLSCDKKKFGRWKLANGKRGLRKSGFLYMTLYLTVLSPNHQKTYHSHMSCIIIVSE